MKAKCIFPAMVMLMCSMAVQAQQGINYKAIIYDDNGDVLANTEVTIRFTILKIGSSISYNESHRPTTDANGIIIVSIGEGTVFRGDFDTINWANGPYALQTEIDTGEGFTDMGTTEFKTVPYALYANEAAESQSLADVLEIDNSANAQIKNLSDPIEDQDAVNKAYLTEQVALLEAQIENLKAALSAADLPTLIDVDGNPYKTVRIGDQIWMAENLKTTTLNDGTPMSYGENMSGNEPVYFWYIDYYARPPDSTGYRDTYGALYNEAAVISTKLCPEGWRIPFNEDWIELEIFLGMDPEDAEMYGDDRGHGEYIGTLLKSTDGWHESPFNPPPPGIVTNESGFGAMGGGYILGNIFEELTYTGYWWGIELDRFIEYSYTRLRNDRVGVDRRRVDSDFGMSVRCISHRRPSGCLDRDGDGFGQGDGCPGPDCDDQDYRINPAAEEVRNGIDDNCNGEIDEGFESE